MAIRILVEENKPLHEITGAMIFDMTLVSVRHSNRIKAEIIEAMSTSWPMSKVPEITNSEAKELTVTQKLKDEVKRG